MFHHYVLNATNLKKVFQKTMENQRIILTKKLLKDSLLKLLNKKDILSISIKELCELSGINRSSFYRHYDNISDLLDEIVDDIINMIIKTNESASNDPENALSYISDTIEFFFKNTEYDSLIKSSSFVLDKLFKKVENELKKNRHLKNNKYLINYLINGSYGVIKDWIKNGRREDSKEIANIIYKFCSNTVQI